MAKGKTPNHTACHPGKRVIVKFRNGQRIVDVFIERKKGTIILKDFGRVSKKDIESFAVLKRRDGE